MLKVPLEIIFGFMCDGMNRVEFKHETGNIDVFILNNGSWLIPYCKNYMRAVFGKTEVIYPYNLPLFNCFLICVQIWKICKKVVFYEWILEMLSLQVQIFCLYKHTNSFNLFENNWRYRSMQEVHFRKVTKFAISSMPV